MNTQQEPVRPQPFQPTSDAIATREAGMLDVAMSRQAQEVQAAMVVAKRYPRDEVKAYNRIMKACSRKTLADEACYVYPRGGTNVTGPSIRLAESLAQNWGNMDFGIMELDQRPGESDVMTYAWDLETNSRSCKIFTVKHERHTRNGVTALSDPRDIYELVANNGARRLRACILAIIPGDIVEAAVTKCDETMRTKNEGPIEDRVRTMVASFGEIGVTIEMLEKRLGHKMAACIETELVQLRKIFKTIRDGAAGRDQFFEVEVVASGSAPGPQTGGPGSKNVKRAKPTATATATTTNMEDKEHGAPAEGGNAEGQTPAVLPNLDKPLVQLEEWCKRDGIDHDKVLHYAKVNKLCEKTCEVMQTISDASMRKMLINWANVSPVIKSIVVPQA